MICVTAKEATAQQTYQRISTSSIRFHEIRLDFSQEIDAHLRLVARLSRSHDLLVTCRPTRDRGAYDGPEKKRLSFLQRALDAGAKAIDIEWDSDRSAIVTLAKHYGPNRLVASSHIWQPVGPEDAAGLEHRIRDMADLPVETIKLAAAITDTADVALFMDMHKRVPDRLLVVIPMGPTGQIGRIKPEALHSAWTYVAATPEGRTAPGQINLDQAKFLRIGQPHHLLALVGGPSVQDSPGPLVYNEWLAGQGLPFQYLAAQTTRFRDTVELLRRFGLVGASVTMPHKAAALELADQLHPQAQAVGAANTLVHFSIPAAGSKRATGPDQEGPEGWQALNTDVFGIRQAIRAAGRLDGCNAVILGAGGAAGAAVYALQGLGARVTLVVRTPKKARALCERFGVTAQPWSTLDEISFDVLVNATPVGRDGQTLPVAPERLTDKVVLDMLLRPHPSPLVLAAKRSRAKVVASGMDMWVAQGRAQLRRWTGLAPDETWLSARVDALLRS